MPSCCWTPCPNFWTTESPITNGPQERLKRQYASLTGWPIKVEDINCTIWLPAGLRREFDPPFIKDFVFRTADLQLPDIADMLGVNVMSDPQGILLSEVVDKVRQVGYTTDEGTIPAEKDAGIDELLDCLESDVDFKDPRLDPKRGLCAGRPFAPCSATSTASAANRCFRARARPSPIC